MATLPLVCQQSSSPPDGWAILNVPPITRAALELGTAYNSGHNPNFDRTTFRPTSVVSMELVPLEQANQRP